MQNKKITALIFLSGYSQCKKIHQLLITVHKYKGHLYKNEKILQHLFICFIQKNTFINVKISVMTKYTENIYC